MVMNGWFRFYCFLLFLSLFVPSHQNEEELLKQLKVATGVFRDPDRLLDYQPYISQLRKTVILTAANNAYLNHIHNFICFLDRLGMKALALALDDPSHNHITNLKPSDNSTIYSYRMRGKDHVWSQSANFRSPQFHVMSMLKIEGALQIYLLFEVDIHTMLLGSIEALLPLFQKGFQVLKLGYDVFFIDPDCILLRDPLKYLLWKNVDYVHSVNLRCNISQPAWNFYTTEQEGNTGFYLMRSNTRTITLMERVVKKAPSMRQYDDQTIFWLGLRRGEYGRVLPLPQCSHYQNDSLDLSTLVSCPLDGCQFSSGALPNNEDDIMYKLLLEALRTKKQPLISVHANYMIGNQRKMDMLKQKGFWITEWPKSGQCQPYSHPFP